MSHSIRNEINQLAGMVSVAVPQVRAVVDRRRASNPAAAPRRRRRSDAFAAVQQPPLSWS